MTQFTEVRIVHRESTPSPTLGIIVASSTDPLLDAEDDRQWRTADWRLRVRKRGRISISSAGWTWIVGMTVSASELERLRDVLFFEGKRAWMICMVRTADMMVLCVGLSGVEVNKCGRNYWAKV
jgi:hypothetical protein